jgi:putative phage-type endonuclease
MQRTEEWFRQRRGKLTASTLGQALGLTPWGSPKALAAAIRRDLSAEGAPAAIAPSSSAIGSNVAMRWGTDKEPNGVMEYMALSGNVVDETGFWEHGDLDWIGGSPDGLIGTDGLLEVKCPFTKRVYEHFPPYYYLQVNALLEITGRKWCDLFVWTPTGHKCWRVQANKQAFSELVCHYARFWAQVHSGQEPKRVPLLPQINAWMAKDVALVELPNAPAHMIKEAPETVFS